MGVFDRIADFIRGPRPEAYPPHETLEPSPGRRSVVEETPWQPLGGVGAASIRHVITRDSRGYYVQREDDDEWSPVPPVGPFRALRDALHEAEMDFEDLRASFASYEARSREPEVAPWWDVEPERDPYIPTAQEEAEVEAWEQAERDRDSGPVPERYGVEAVHTSDWHIYVPGEEMREHIGRSPEGWHYAVETSRFGGDDYLHGLSWSFAYPTREHAEASMQTAVLHLDLCRDDGGHEP